MIKQEAELIQDSAQSTFLHHIIRKRWTLTCAPVHDALEKNDTLHAGTGTQITGIQSPLSTRANL